MIKLRKIQKSDLKMRVEWMNNPIIYNNMHFTPPISFESTQRWFEKNQDATCRIDVAFDNEEGDVVAMGGLTHIDYTVRKAEFYIFVNPNFLRRGYGSMSAYLLCKYGFEVLQLHKIYLFANNGNIIARKTYEKLGFKLEGTMRHEMVRNEQYEDRLYYGLLASEFDHDKVALRMVGCPSVDR